jgi:hypothetical protein
MPVVAFPRRAPVAPRPPQPTADEGLRLLSAFINIRDADLRAVLVALAERYAAKTS